VFDRDEQEISQIIESGIAAILSGQATLEEVLAAHPAQADELRGELAGALWLVARQAEVAARPGFVSASRKRVLERIQAEADGQGVRRAFFGFAWPRRLAFQWLAAAVVVLVLVFGTGGAVSLAQSALPGEELYAVKRAAEQVSYAVTLNDVARVELSAQFASRRLNEVETLMAKGNNAEAEATLKEFDRQVNQTIALLQNVSDTRPQEKLSAADTLKEDLLEEAIRLADLQAGAPAALQDSLIEAAGLAGQGASMVSDIIKDLPNSTATPDFTPTVTSTYTATAFDTPTPLFTETPVPSATTEDMTLDVSPDESDPSLTNTPGDPTRTPRPKRTPKPAQRSDKSGGKANGKNK
jgi:hypothetical protein